MQLRRRPRQGGVLALLGGKGGGEGEDDVGEPRMVRVARHWAFLCADILLGIEVVVFLGVYRRWGLSGMKAFMARDFASLRAWKVPLQIEAVGGIQMRMRCGWGS